MILNLVVVERFVWTRKRARRDFAEEAAQAAICLVDAFVFAFAGAGRGPVHGGVCLLGGWGVGSGGAFLDDAQRVVGAEARGGGGIVGWRVGLRERGRGQRRAGVVRGVGEDAAAAEVEGEHIVNVVCRGRGRRGLETLDAVVTRWPRGIYNGARGAARRGFGAMAASAFGSVGRVF